MKEDIAGLLDGGTHDLNDSCLHSDGPTGGDRDHRQSLLDH